MDEVQKELANARLVQAGQCLKSARILADINDYKGAANRSYYAIFHSMRSVLALDGKDFAKHAGVISGFRKDYIKTGQLPVELSAIITSAFDVRSDCDYDDYYVIDKSEVSEQINNGEKFYNIVKSYVLERLERLDEAHIVNDGITDYEDGEIVDGKKTLKKMRDKYGV